MTVDEFLRAVDIQAEYGNQRVHAGVLAQARRNRSELAACRRSPHPLPAQRGRGRSAARAVAVQRLGAHG